MYRSLITNTVISAAAYFAISVIGIIVIRWLVGAYGLAAYGMIALSRLFLPTGLANMLDLGAPENASHFVASSRATGDWANAGAILAALAFIMSLGAILPSAILFFGATPIANLFNLSAADTAIFARTLHFIALITPLLLIGALAEGVIRGFERYDTARGIEVAASLAYGFGCYLLIHYQYPPAAILYLGVALALARACVAILACLRCFATTSITFRHWRTHGLSHAWARTCVTAPNKMLGTLQTQSPTLLIGIFLGPVSTASFDVLTRLPRFAKSVLGLLNSAIMPFTSRLEAADKNIGHVAESGLLLVAVLAAAPLFAAATFSRPLLELWVGPELTAYWFWQSIGFTTPLITVLLSFGFNTLFGRIHVNKAANRFIVFRIGIQYAVAFALLSLLAERAFVLGGVLAVLFTAFWEFRIIFREHRLNRTLAQRLFTLIGIGAVLTLVLIPLQGYIHSLILLAGAIGLYSILFWGLAWLWILPTATKKALIKHGF